MAFFQVIIPLHNKADRLALLLQNIKDQNDDISVIVANDSSTDNYMEVINKFSSDLSIEVVDVNTDKHCPGNSRQAGLDKATGEWITFVDHDDLFEDGAFNAVHKCINEKKLDKYCFTFFTEYTPDCSQVIKNFDSAAMCLTWMHGKFYKKSFIDELELHFMGDLLTHEDVYFNHALIAKMHAKGLLGDNSNLEYQDIKTYKWLAWPDSTSRQWGPEFIYQHMDDYIISLADGYFEIAMNNWQVNDDYYKYLYRQVAADYVSMYFYYQADLYHNGWNFNAVNYKYIGEYLNKVTTTCKLDINVVNSIIVSNAQQYNLAKTACEIATGPFIPKQSFLNFSYSFA